MNIQYQPDDFRVTFGEPTNDTWADLYEKYLDIDRAQAPKIQLNCINEENHAHGDKNKSAFVDLKTGVYFCSVCGSFSPFRFLVDIIKLTPQESSELTSDFKSRIVSRNPSFHLDLAGRTDAPLYGLEKVVFDASTQLNPDIPIVRDYIEQRGISFTTLAAWKIGHVPNRGDQQECLLFPYFYKNSVAALKGRNAVGQKGAMPNSRLVPFGLQFLEKAKYAVVVEGESDTLATWQALKNYGRISSDVAVVGIPGAQNFKSEWRKFFTHLEKILVIPQIDDAGEMMASTLMDKLGKGFKDRVKIISLPFGFNDTGKDIIDFIRSHSEAEFVNILPPFDESEPFVLSFDDMVEKSDGEIEWIIPHFLATNEKLMIFGAPKGMKTFVAIHLAKCVAAGLPFLQNPEWIPSPKKVLFVEFEGNVTQFARRVVKMLEPDDKNVGLYRENIRFIHKKSIKLDEPDSVVRLQKVIEEFEPSVVIFDPLKSLHGQDENDATAMGMFWDSVNDMLREYPDMAVVFVHHVAKAEKGKKLDLYAARGSSITAAEVDAGLGLNFGTEETDDADVILLGTLIGREIPNLGGQMQIKVDTDNFDMVFENVILDETPTSKTRQCIQDVLAIMSAEPESLFTVNDLEVELDHSPALIRKTLKELEERKLLFSEGKRPVKYGYKG